MKQGTVLHVCVSERKGTAKSPIRRGVLKEGYGITGDAHGGSWHRQISLLDNADIETVRRQGLELEPGAFGENLVVEGLELGMLGIGTRLRVGEAELEITQLGKICHNRCAIYFRTGDCIMPRTGLFGRVIQGGDIAPGMSIEVTEEVRRSVVQAAVLTVSDRCAAHLAEDTAGPAVAMALKNRLEAHVAWTGIVADDRESITETLKDLADRRLDIVVTTGGTGCGPRDVTPEATLAVVTRDVPGLAEAMRTASAARTPHALLQRGICGICESTLILNLPASPTAALENLTAVHAALPHAVQLLRGYTLHGQIRSDARRPSMESHRIIRSMTEGSNQRIHPAGDVLHGTDKDRTIS